ncbi:MAG: YfhO family protein, partial [Anaerolineae bacterium]|nr:YfhO family protein [Anaerolineae bacterium]
MLKPTTESRLCALVITLFVVLLLWRPLFAGETFFWGTPLLQFIPWLRQAASMWRAGHVPLWNPLVGCGAPLAANYQTAVFYPPNLLYLLLPAEVALVWLTALHLLLAGWGMYRWGRAVGLSPFSSSIGALAVAGSGFLVARVALFPSIVCTFPWLPVWLWCAEELLQRRGRRELLRMGLALGMGLLAGHAQTAFYGGVLLLAYVIFRAVRQRGEMGTIPAFALAVVLGIGLAAVQLLPTAELMLLSQRSGGVRYDLAMTYSFWPWRLITLVAPHFFGNPGQGDYWGYATYWEDAGYVGLLPLLLALWAVVGRSARRGESAFWTGIALIALTLALGKNTPLFPLLFRYLPTFDWFQAPARWLAVVTIALGALAALGAERWPIGGQGRRYGTWAIVGGLAMLVGGAAARVVVPGMPATFSPAVIRLGATLIAIGALALLRRDRAWWRGAVLGLIALDLLLAGWPLIPTIARSLYHTTSEIAAALSEGPGPERIYWPIDPANPGSDRDAEYRVRFSYLAFDRFGPRDVSYWSQMHEILLPNTAMLDGLASANNFDSLLPGWYWELSARVAAHPSLLRICLLYTS